jgi:hypothetical protein
MFASWWCKNALIRDTMPGPSVQDTTRRPMFVSHLGFTAEIARGAVDRVLIAGRST